jgi:hypothetical protein
VADIEVEELVFILPLHDEVDICELDIRQVAGFTRLTRLVGPFWLEQIGICIAGAVGIEIELTVFEGYFAQFDAAVEQAFEEIAGNIDTGGVEEVVVVLLPGAVTQRYIGEAYGDGREIAKEGDLQRADMGVALQMGFNGILRFVQDGSLVELDIDRQDDPGKK